MGLEIKFNPPRGCLRNEMKIKGIEFSKQFTYDIICKKIIDVVKIL